MRPLNQSTSVQVNDSDLTLHLSLKLVADWLLNWQFKYSTVPSNYGVKRIGEFEKGKYIDWWCSLNFIWSYGLVKFKFTVLQLLISWKLSQSSELMKSRSTDGN